MRAALGLKSHSGWAALVAVAIEQGAWRVLERRRIELAGAEEGEWSGQPYHAADGKPPAQAQAIVARGVAQAQRCAVTELRAARQRLRDLGHDLVVCAVLAPAPLPPWSTAEILAVHLRMHQAEGALYPDALLSGAAQAGLQATRIAAKTLRADAARAFGIAPAALDKRLAALGKPLGPPWTADQKNAACAALIALAGAQAGENAA